NSRIILNYKLKGNFFSPFKSLPALGPNRTHILCMHTVCKDVEQRTKFIAGLEGNIGSGKTSLVAELKRRINNSSLEPLKFVDEPVEKWTDFNGINLLQLMYSDPIRWSNLFQAYVMLTMVDGHRQADLVSEGPCLIERTLHSCAQIFVKSLHQRGQLESCDYEILCQWYKSFIENQLYHLDLIIYLRASPSVCLERVRRRDRNEERGISLELLAGMHELHESWLASADSRPPIGADRVVVLDAECSPEQLNEQWDRLVVPLLPSRKVAE
ncbi:hypothetical protein BOX15_Mlig015182g1, partial [Macrostomum lignano]